MAVKDKKQRLPLTFLAFVLYHLLLASLLSNNPKQSCSRGGLVLEETGLQYASLQTSLVLEESDSQKNARIIMTSVDIRPFPGAWTAELLGVVLGVQNLPFWHLNS